MKDEVILKDNFWYWPKIDNASWNGQLDCIDLADKIMPYVDEKKIMVQAGGNCGLILSKFVDRFETVYTFEPEPVNFYCLNLNITNKNVIKFQSCLGSDSETVSINHIYPGGTDIGGSHVTGVGKTPTITIDSLNLPYCNLIQLDVEGYELKALMGAKQTINKFKPVLCVEVYDGWLNRYQHTGQDLINFIIELGYEEVETYKMDKIFVPKK